MSLTIETRALGRRKPLLSDFDVPPPPDLHDDGSLVLGQLIAHVVRHQVAAFEARQDAMRFDRVLSAKQIEAGGLAGKVDPAAKEHAPAEVDAEAAVATALQAFEDGLYLVIIDEVERRSLEEPVYLASTSRMAFVRLTFLAGA